MSIRLPIHECAIVACERPAIMNSFGIYLCHDHMIHAARLMDDAEEDGADQEAAFRKYVAETKGRPPKPGKLKRLLRPVPGSKKPK